MQNIFLVRPLLDIFPARFFNDTVIFSDDVIALFDDDFNITGSTNEKFRSFSTIRGARIKIHPII